MLLRYRLQYWRVLKRSIVFSKLCCSSSMYMHNYVYTSCTSICIFQQFSTIQLIFLVPFLPVGLSIGHLTPSSADKKESNFAVPSPARFSETWRPSSFYQMGNFQLVPTLQKALAKALVKAQPASILYWFFWAFSVLIVHPWNWWYAGDCWRQGPKKKRWKEPWPRKEEFLGRGFSACKLQQGSKEFASYSSVALHKFHQILGSASFTDLAGLLAGWGGYFAMKPKSRWIPDWVSTGVCWDACCTWISVLDQRLANTWCVVMFCWFCYFVLRNSTLCASFKCYIGTRTHRHIHRRRWMSRYCSI